MMWAASGGHLEILTWLVEECGCDVDARNKVGRTALMFAAKYAHHECLRWLVCNAKADPSLRAEDDSGAEYIVLRHLDLKIRTFAKTDSGQPRES